jgi:hypothetical protein
VALALLLAAGQASAFSLLGPVTTWMTVRLGYDLNMPNYGGPMNLGEEYRWNIPEVYYGFTPDFLNYFGKRGADEVDKAFKILNDLPAASKLVLTNFPMDSQRVNHRAQALGIVDLKSWTLSILLNQMGICDPTRFVFTLRSRWIGPSGSPTNFYVIRRNFDPVTLKPTPYINGVLWTYNSISDGDTRSFVNCEPVDPLALFGLLNAPVSSGQGNSYLLFGGFWTTLTYDDVGGLRYIYHKNNLNVENAVPPVTGGGGGVWGAPPGTTNVATTNIFYDVALRPGLDKIKFTRRDYDSLMGVFATFTNNFTDTVITNSRSITQGASRPVAVPDILFDVADLQGGDATDVFTTHTAALTAWDNNDDINGVTQGNYGPGVIPPGGTAPSFTVIYNSVGEMLWNIWPSFLDQLSAGTVGWYWGAFDGTTNEPMVFPDGVSIQALEQAVLSADQGSPWEQP